MATEILIVDDNADIRNILNELILDAGYKTRVAANYNQALSEIDKKMPDVAILDVKLDKGDNDGIELLSHIKSINKDVPVIVITGHANIEMAVNSLKKGAFEFVEKPFDRNRLLNFISRAVENLNLKIGGPRASGSRKCATRPKSNKNQELPHLICITLAGWSLYSSHIPGGAKFLSIYASHLQCGYTAPHTFCVGFHTGWASRHTQTLIVFHVSFFDEDFANESPTSRTIPLDSSENRFPY